MEQDYSATDTRAEGGGIVAITPFDATASLQGQPGDPTKAEAAIPAVPSAKLLVLRHVFADLELPRGQHLVMVNLIYNTQGVSNAHWFIPTLGGNPGMGTNEAWLVSEHTHLYVETGAAIQAFAIKTEVEGAMSGIVTLSGELVDA
jgi:hypothetical protein